jgi:hypothetical protein
VNDKIMEYFKHRSQFAFTQKELRNALDIRQGLSARLSYLKKRGLLLHTNGYWYYKPQVKRKGKGSSGQNGRRKRSKSKK